MNSRELAFRKTLIEAMRGLWRCMINVENHLNPGVPDLAIVALNADCETGWLELKSLPDTGESVSVKIEQSQHVWMHRNANQIPAYFLIEHPRGLFLVDGSDHANLSAIKTYDGLTRLSTRTYLAHDWRANLHADMLTLTSRSYRRNRA